MATLTIRNVPPAVHARLRVRAARAGRSMEAEIRAILEEATMPTEAGTSVHFLRDWVDQVYGSEKPSRVVEDLIDERRREGRGE